MPPPFCFQEKQFSFHCFNLQFRKWDFTNSMFVRAYKTHFAGERLFFRSEISRNISTTKKHNLHENLKNKSEISWDTHQISLKKSEILLILKLSFFRNFESHFFGWISHKFSKSHKSYYGDLTRKKAFSEQRRARFLSRTHEISTFFCEISFFSVRCEFF